MKIEASQGFWYQKVGAENSLSKLTTPQFAQQ